MLSSILIAAELIELELEPDSPIRPRLEIIYQVSQQARDLTRQILSFGRRTEHRQIPFDLANLLRQACQLLKATLPKNVHLRRDLATSAWVEGDPAQTHQVVMNLAINGAHAIGSGEGTLTLTLGKRQIEASDGLPLPPGLYAELCVRDTGCGIPPAIVPRIFEPFFTTKDADTGTGLGLSVVHGIVHSHGGHIQVESTPGQGSCFRVYLPATLQEAAVPLAEPRQPAQGTERILLVDDEDIVTALTKQGLEALGYDVVAKTSPIDALEVFQARPGAFDLLITDLTLPGFSGAELARRIRRLRPGLPAILTTGTAGVAGTMPSIAEAFAEILAKPLAPRDLGAAIRRVLDPLKLAQAEPYPEVEGLLEPGDHPLILVAEDSQATRTLLRTWLEKAGYRVQEARDGQEAWEYFTAARNQTPYSLVLTDIVMPRMDGLELVEKIRKAGPDVPVVILSSLEDAEAGKKALQLHVNDFLMKPFDAHVLVAALARLVEAGLFQARKAQLVETAQAVRLAQKVMEAVPEEDLPVYSISEPLTEAGGDIFRAIRRPDGTTLLLLADVAGHSVLSSYAVASFLGMLSTFLQEAPDVTALFQALNRTIQDGPFPEIPIAALAAHWTPRTGRLHVVNAGIPYGLWLRAGLGRAETIPLDGAPLGLLPQPRTTEKILFLEPGDRLLFGTDGLFDVRSEAGDTFRQRALAQWQELGGLPVAEALIRHCEAARAHGNGVIGDDLLAIALEQPAWVPGQGEFLRCLPSTLEALEAACGDFEAFLSDQPLALAKARAFEVQLAVREALSNAFRHGNLEAAHERIILQAHLEARDLVVRVVDAGRKFRLERLWPKPAPSAEGQRGLNLLQTLGTQVTLHGGELTFRMALQGVEDGV